MIREVVIDLSAVSTRDQFQRELSRHLPIGVDRRDLWPTLANYLLIGRGGPLRLRFVGWSQFERRMPRYAARLVRLFGQFRQWHLTVVFD